MTLELQTPSSMASPHETPSSNWFVNFFKGVQQAWHKITWPTVPQLSTQVLITIAVTVFATTLIWGLDNVYRILIQTFVLPKS